MLCCVQAVPSCSLRGGSGRRGSCRLRRDCAWNHFSEADGAEGCEAEADDVRCCINDNTPMPPTSPPTPRPPTQAPTPRPRTQQLPPSPTPPFSFTGSQPPSGACSGIDGCGPRGVCISENVCACQYPFVPDARGCTIDEAVAAQSVCRAKSCASSLYCGRVPTADRTLCFDGAGSFVNLALDDRVDVVEQTPAPPQAPPSPSDAGLPMTLIIGLAVGGALLLGGSIIFGMCVLSMAIRRRMNEKEVRLRRQTHQPHLSRQESHATSLPKARSATRSSPSPSPGSSPARSPRPSQPAVGYYRSEPSSAALARDRTPNDDAGYSHIPATASPAATLELDEDAAYSSLPATLSDTSSATAYKDLTLDNDSNDGYRRSFLGLSNDDEDIQH